MRESETSLSKSELNYIKSRLKSRNPVIQFDLLKMYFGKPYEIDLEGVDGSITIYPPTIGDVVDYGEKEWYANLSPLISNTTTYRYPLSLQGIDWTQLSDFELFCSCLYNQPEPEFNQILFHQDLSEFSLHYREIEGEEGEIKHIPVLYNEETETEINEQVYFHISQYLRKCFHNEPKEQMTTQEALKKVWLRKDATDIHNAKWREKNGLNEENVLMNLISSCINHPGFSYKINELSELPMFAFMDSVARLQLYESTIALLHGSYSGMCDMSKIDKENFNFMREIKFE